MVTKIPIELLPPEKQIASLRSFLHPSRSPIRPFLALFAVKNYLLREAGFVDRNEPTTRWYQERLMRAGLGTNTSDIQSQLEKLADLGVVDRKRGRGWSGARRDYMYQLNEAIYPTLERALKQLLGVNVFSKLTSR